MSNTPQTPDTQLKKLKRDNHLMLVACLMAILALLSTARLLWIPNTVMTEGYNGWINPNDPYVKLVAANISHKCDGFEQLRVGCLYHEATDYVNEHVTYSQTKLNVSETSKIDRFLKYELPASRDPHYNEDVLTGKTDAVCSDMAVVLCSILRSLNVTCELATRLRIEDNKYNGHMYVRGIDSFNKTISCDPTTGYCYGGDDE